MGGNNLNPGCNCCSICVPCSEGRPTGRETLISGFPDTLISTNYIRPDDCPTTTPFLIDCDTDVGYDDNAPTFHSYELEGFGDYINDLWIDDEDAEVVEVSSPFGPYCDFTSTRTYETVANKYTHATGSSSEIPGESPRHCPSSSKTFCKEIPCVVTLSIAYLAVSVTVQFRDPIYLTLGISYPEMFFFINFGIEYDEMDPSVIVDYVTDYCSEQNEELEVTTYHYLIRTLTNPPFPTSLACSGGALYESCRTVQTFTASITLTPTF